jgi:hypothetical protein
MSTPAHVIRPIHFEKKNARLDVPHYHLVGVLLDGDAILFWFDSLRVVVRGENMPILFARFSERQVYWLEEGPVMRFSGSSDKYLITHIRFHGTEIDDIDEGPASPDGLTDEYPAGQPLRAVPLLRFQQSGQGKKLALPAHNLLQIASTESKMSLLFEHWRIQLAGKGMPFLHELLRDSIVRVITEGVTVESEDGKSSYHVEEMQFTTEE